MKEKITRIGIERKKINNHFFQHPLVGPLSTKCPMVVKRGSDKVIIR